MISIIGLSRRSSVPGLKLKPRMPTRVCPFSMINLRPLATCNSLLGRMELRMGNSRSRSFALYASARRSFGKHEPPNANPGIR